MTQPEPNNTSVNTGIHARHLLAFVAECPAVCPVCDYSLVGLAEPRCPECGAELRLQVGSPRLRVGPWALAMVSFALALGFDGVVSIMMILAIALSPNAGLIAFGIVSIFLLLSGGMAAGLIAVARGQTKWTRRPIRNQWTIAGTIFVVVGGLHALVGIGWVSLWA